jgi:hypothetical protein
MKTGSMIMGSIIPRVVAHCQLISADQKCESLRQAGNAEANRNYEMKPFKRQIHYTNYMLRKCGNDADSVRK